MGRYPINRPVCKPSLTKSKHFNPDDSWPCNADHHLQQAEVDMAETTQPRCARLSCPALSRVTAQAAKDTYLRHVHWQPCDVVLGLIAVA